MVAEVVRPVTMEFAELIVRWRLRKALARRFDLATVATAAAKVGVAGWLYRMTVQPLAYGDHLAFREREMIERVIDFGAISSNVVLQLRLQHGPFETSKWNL